MEKDGFVLLKNHLSKTEASSVTKWADELEKLPEEKNKWMIYFEKDNLKSRMENFLPYHQELNDFLNNKIKPLLEQTINQKTYLLKDKINWKQAKGQGFYSHQDHPAWTDFLADRYYSVAIFPDGSTKENGCLEVVYDKNDKLLENDLSKGGMGKLKDEDNFTWHALETTPRDILIFDSYIPHRSHKNTTDKSRRVFYFTFNNIDFGDNYKQYYINKKEIFPPDIERIEGKKYNVSGNKYNLANPIL